MEISGPENGGTVPWGHIISPYIALTYPYIGLTYGRYLQLRYLKYPKMAFDLVLRFDMAPYSIACGRYILDLLWESNVTLGYRFQGSIQVTKRLASVMHHRDPEIETQQTLLLGKNTPIRVQHVKSMWKFGQGFPVSVWPTVCQVTRISLIFQKQPLHPAAPWQRGNYSRTDLERRATDFLYIMFILCSFMFIHIHSYSTYSMIFHRDHFLCTLDMQEDQ